MSGPTRDEIMKYTNLFRRRDVDGNGVLDRTELRGLVQSVYTPSETEVTAVFNQFDINKDGKIVFAEFLEALHFVPHPTSVDKKALAVKKQEEEALRKKFDSIAIKGSAGKENYISLLEARRLAQDRFVPPETIIDKIMAVLDVDKDSKVTEADWIKAMHKASGHIQTLFKEAGVTESDWKAIPSRRAPLPPSGDEKVDPQDRASRSGTVKRYLDLGQIDVFIKYDSATVTAPLSSTPSTSSTTTTTTAPSTTSTTSGETKGETKGESKGESKGEEKKSEEKKTEEAKKIGRRGSGASLTGTGRRGSKVFATPLLRCSVIAGKDLAIFDKTSSDPFCRVFISEDGVVPLGTIYKSDTKSNNLNPKWDFFANLDTDITAHPTAKYLTIEVWDNDLTSDDFMGYVRWELKDIDHEPQQGKWALQERPGMKHPKAKEKKEEKVVEVKKERDPNDLGSVDLVIKAQHVGDKDSKKKPTLKITVIAGQNLTIKDSKASDPYVKVWIGDADGGKVGTVHESEVKKNTLTPKWDYFCNLDSDIQAHPTAATLVVECWDKDIGSKDDFMGWVVIPFADIDQSETQQGKWQLEPRERTKKPEKKEEKKLTSAPSSSSLSSTPAPAKTTSTPAPSSTPAPTTTTTTPAPAKTS